MPRQLNRTASPEWHHTDLAFSSPASHVHSSHLFECPVLSPTRDWSRPSRASVLGVLCTSQETHASVQVGTLLLSLPWLAVSALLYFALSVYSPSISHADGWCSSLSEGNRRTFRLLPVGKPKYECEVDRKSGSHRSASPEGLSANDPVWKHAHHWCWPAPSTRTRGDGKRGTLSLRREADDGGPRGSVLE